MNMRRALLPWIGLGLVFLSFIATGWRGVNFGKHWDEPRIMHSVVHSVENGYYFPLDYIWPSLTWDIAMACLTPDVVKKRVCGYDPSKLAGIAGSEPFLLRVRSVFIIICAFSICWVFLAVFLAGRGTWEALAAATLMGTSFEYAYHARWAVPDAVMAQWAALFLVGLSLYFFQPAHREKGLLLCAVSGGLACGTKYPGGALLLPLSILLFLSWRGGDEQPRIGGAKVIAALSIFCTVFLLTTPGFIKDFDQLFRELAWHVNYYAHNSAVYSVESGWDHTGRIMTYFGGVVFSHFPVVAIGFSLFFPFGLWDLKKENGRFIFAFLSFPLFYFWFFSRQEAMIVRNLLALIPFAALITARGMSMVFASTETLISGRIMRMILGGLLIAGFTANVAWLWYAAETIVQRGKIDYVQQLADFIASRPKRSFFVSPAVAQDLSRHRTPGLANVTSQLSPACDYSVINTFEINSNRWKWENLWAANRFFNLEAVFGPCEVNIECYPSWLGDDRFLVLPMK
ncbi:glycosyltransferase family 39 protein [Candidatus Ozemobacteraceae bacterium]|nr:glycosyltransferase family 39 protein [Candidatus Ozemobacteraceae bacterium]